MNRYLGITTGLTGIAAIGVSAALIRRSMIAAGVTAAAITGPAALGDSVPVSGELYVSGLSRPVEMVQDPANDNVQYVVQQSGLIRVIENGILSGSNFLSVTAHVGSTSNEKGLLGLAIPPQGVSRNDEDYVYVNHTEFPGGFGATNFTHIVRYRRTAPGALTVDSGSRLEILSIEQDYENHNGGHIAFGPDGMLYIGMGDGGSGGDPDNRAQSKDQLLGKMLRINVNVLNPDAQTYSVPSDNPFVGATGDLAGTLPEIWAFGVRNPWKWTFDDFGCASTGAMVIADVGQDAWEEVDYQAGDYDPSVTADRLNYGWRHREGLHPFNSSVATDFPSFIDPIHEYSHGTGFSITGGYVYRGASMLQNRGRYFFADFVTSRLWSMDVTNGVASDLVSHFSEIFNGTTGLSYSGASAFAVDADGEIYVLNYGSGQIIRILATLTPGDLNGDGIVDTADLGVLIALFGSTDNAADINGDCTVDTADLGVLIANFGS